VLIPFDFIDFHLVDRRIRIVHHINRSPATARRDPPGRWGDEGLIELFDQDPSQLIRFPLDVSDAMGGLPRSLLGESPEGLETLDRFCGLSAQEIKKTVCALEKGVFFLNPKSMIFSFLH